MRKSNIKAVLKEKVENEERWMLTPKGIAVVSLLEAELISDIDDVRAERFWEWFDALMTINGYVKEATDGEARNE